MNIGVTIIIKDKDKCPKGHDIKVQTNGYAYCVECGGHTLYQLKERD